MKRPLVREPLTLEGFARPVPAFRVRALET